jgi:hypothetical protein
MKPKSPRRSRASFLLLEAMLSVMVFALGVLALGRAVSQGLVAEIARNEDQRARLALENRMSEIEHGPLELRAEQTGELDGIFEGMKLAQTFEPAGLMDEEKKEITGIDKVTLTVSWESEGEPQSKQIWFYVLSQK